MKIRLAETQEDLQVLDPLLRGYVAEQAAGGSPIRFTRKTLDGYRELARSYVLGSAAGAVALAEAPNATVGFALGGEDYGFPRFDTELGRCAVVWGIWVAPDIRKAGLALAMLKLGCERCRELGLQTAVMGVRQGNEEGHALTRSYGAVPAETIYHFRIQEG